MIKTMHEFGRHLREIDDMKPFFEIAAAPYPDKATDETVIVAEIKSRIFQGIELEKYSKARVWKYLFRELASSRSTSIVPTLHFYYQPKAEDLKDSITKFLDKLKRSLENNLAIYQALFDVEPFLKALPAALSSLSLSEKKNVLFTLRIDEKWLGEIPEVNAILEESSYDKYFRDGKGELFQGENQICAVSYEPSAEVWGRVDTLGFTVNDIAFSRGGFDATKSYRMFPVSPEAVKTLEGTRRALDAQLSFNFSTLKFFVLPHFVTFDETQNEQKKRLVRRFVQAIQVKDPSFDALAGAIINSEGIFKSILKDPELGHNSVYYDIFFFEKSQAQFSIKLHVSDVLPSRFSVIMKTKARLENRFEPITRIDPTGKDPILFRLNFFSIKEFFSTSKVIDPYFFKIIEAIFYKNRLDEEQILRAFMHKIVPAFKNQSEKAWEFPSHVKRSFCILQYFQQLQLFGKMTTPNDGELALTAKEFVEQHEEGFFKKQPLKKAAFYLGCATEKLLYHQSWRNSGNKPNSKPGNKPFQKELMHLYITPEKMNDIFHKLKVKADQYQNDSEPRFYYPEFNEALSYYGESFAQITSQEVSKTELSYAFSLGMVMEIEFRKRSIQLANERKAAKKAAEEAAKKVNQIA